VAADAANTKAWWDGQPFDRILLDAPCSASGVIRRHPDIKLLRQASDIKTLAKEQLRLLKALWPLLKPGGLMLYVTCSIFPEENSQVVQAFLKDQADAKEEIIQASWGIPCAIGRQILPGDHRMDGFYYAILKSPPKG
jgi:16S rRNA (cytosine967-C5)-methyltransferase